MHLTRQKLEPHKRKNQISELCLSSLEQLTKLELKDFFLFQIKSVEQSSSSYLHSSLCRIPLAHSALHIGKLHPGHKKDSSTFLKHCKHPGTVLAYGPTTAGSSDKINSQGPMSLDATMYLFD